MGRIIAIICGVVLAAGLLAFSQPNLAEPGQANRGAQRKEEPSVSSVASLPHDSAPRAPQYRNPCKYGSEREDSDLCAQWAAADSALLAAEIAANQNTLVFWSLLVSGGLTLGALIIAAMAVRQTHTAERPYVYFYKTKKMRSPRGRVLGILGVTFQNAGRTSAHVTHLTVKHCLSDTPPDPKQVQLERFPPSAAIFPGSEWPSEGYAPLNVTPSEFQHQSPDGTPLFVYGQMIYRDAFGKAYSLWFCRVYANGSFAFIQQRFPELETSFFNDSRQLRWREFGRMDRAAKPRG